MILNFFLLEQLPENNNNHHLLVSVAVRSELAWGISLSLNLRGIWSRDGSCTIL